MSQDPTDRRRLKPRIVVALVAVMLAAVAVSFAAQSGAASSSAPQTKTIPLLKVGFVYPTDTLDTCKEGSYVGPLGLEKPLQLGNDNKMHPWLVQSWKQTSPTRYVYQVRKGVKFWDGNELTAADIANALNYYREPKCVVSFLFASAKSIQAIGRYTVIVTLRQPDASWNYAMGSWGAGIFEKKFGDAHKGTLGKPGVLSMGTGPWEFDSLDPTTGAELSANPHYWGGPVAIQHISYKLFSDQTSQALAFRAGEIDVAPTIMDGRAWAATAGSAPRAVPSCFTAFITMDTQNGPWSDIHVRRAVAYAINRTDIIKAWGSGTPSQTMISPLSLETVASPAAVQALLKSLPNYAYSLVKAKQELALSTSPNGFSGPITSANDAGSVAVDQVIVDELKPLGINLTVNAVTAAKYSAGYVDVHSNEGIQFETGACNSPDPNENPKWELGSKNLTGYNMANYAPPAVDALLKAGLAGQTSAKRFAAYSGVLKRLATDVPWVELLNQTPFVAVSSKFTWSNYFPAFFTRPWAMGIKAS
jgi:peptide/nickel transport system substrate-binding protein